MKNEEKATQLVQKWAVEGYAEASTYFASCEMAKWKDKQFTNRFNCGKVLQLRRKAYKKGYDIAIEKACEWLNSQACLGWIEDVKADEFIEQFKKAMKE